MNAVLEVREPSARYLEAIESPLVQRFDLLASAQAGVTRLRESILTLAVQGRVVAQDPRDEPASFLLRRIQGERDRMIAAGQIRRTRTAAPLAEDDQPFDAPIGWAWTRLDQLSPYGLSDGDWIETKDQDPDGDVRLIQLADVGDGRFKDKSSRFVSKATCTALNCTLLQPSDILIARLPNPIGRACVFPGVGQQAITAVDVAICRIGQELLPEFVALAINAPQTRLLIESYGKGATRFRVSTGHLKTLPVAVPPVAEQARIVARVDELMRLCDALEAKGRLEAEQHARLLGTLLGTLTDSTTPERPVSPPPAGTRSAPRGGQVVLGSGPANDLRAANWQRVADHFDLLLDRPEAVDALEQTILQLAVRGLLVPQDPSDEPAGELLERIRAENERPLAGGKAKCGKPALPVDGEEVPFELPEPWVWARFAEVAEIASDLVSPGAHKSAWQVAPDCVEKGTGRLLERRTVADAGVKSANHRFRPGQIIYSKIRPSLSKAVIVDFAGLCSADMYPINARIATQYLLLVILSRCFLDQVAIAENRVKMPKLNQEALTAFLVPVPPLAEQARIVARVTELRRLCANLRQRLTASQTTQSHLAEALVEQAAA